MRIILILSAFFLLFTFSSVEFENGNIKYIRLFKEYIPIAVVAEIVILKMVIISIPNPLKITIIEEIGLASAPCKAAITERAKGRFRTNAHFFRHFCNNRKNGVSDVVGTT